MGESSLQALTLNPSETAFFFPPHRRRPFRSRTCYALIRILMSSSQMQMQAREGGGELELRRVREEYGSTIFDEGVNLEAAVISCLDCVQQYEDTLVGDACVSENNVCANFQGGDSECNQASTQELDQVILVTDAVQGVAPESVVNSGNLSIVVTQMAGCATETSKEQDNASKFVIDNHVENVVALEELKVDEEFSIDDYSEVLDSCFGMDMVTKTVLEENIPEETEHELQLKEMELEKLIYSQNADQEFEEGEISGEGGVVDLSFHEEPSSVIERTTETMHSSENIPDKEEFMCTDEGDRGCPKHRASDPSLISPVNCDYNSMSVESGQIARIMQDFHHRNTSNDSHMETQTGRNLEGKAAEDQTCSTVEKDETDKRKKRKNGPLTKEKREKKKKKERLKRAEKNRMLGVKRLKLEPIPKKKTVTYCRHFLHGRCHEGEKCKFSHDTVPLTKSKPCGHFARQSCMKGDSCPYDHQLSKYPCTNYTTNGVCSRGSDCLFSHEGPAKQIVSTPTPDRGKLSSEVNITSHMNDYQKVNAEAGSITGKSLELLVAPKKTTARQAPKGISLLSNVVTSVVGTANDVSVGCSNEPNETPKSVPPRKPRGLNFLSFARPTTTSDDNSTSNNILSKLLPRKSFMDGVGESKAACLLSESVGVLKPNYAQMDHNANNLPSNPSAVNKNFSSLPLLSFDGQNANPSISFRTPFLSNTPTSVQKAVQSTLAFAANNIRVDTNPSSSTSRS